MGSLLHAVGAFSAKRRFAVIGAWILVLAGVVASAALLREPTDDAFSIPGTPSIVTFERLGEAFPSSGGASGDVVFAAPEGVAVTDPAVAAAITEAVANLSATANVAQAANPFESMAVSPDLRVGYIAVNYATSTDELPTTTLADAQEATKPLVDAGLTVEYTGGAFQEQFKAGGGLGEVLGAFVAIVVLYLTLRTVVGAVLPFMTGIAAVGLGVGVVYILTGFTSITSTAPILALMLGLAVGIDYSLFILARHRSQLLAGMGVRESIAKAVGTAGAAVVFAGATVVVALLALFVANIPFLTAMGNAAAGTVALAVIAALTLLPAVLSVAGTRVLPRKLRAKAADAAAGIASGDASAAEPHTNAWVRWVTRRPVLVLVGGVLALLAMAIPAADLRLGLPSERSQPEESSARKGYDLLAEGFGAGFNGPIIVLGEADDAVAGYSAAETFAADAAALENVAFVSPVIPSADGHSFLIQVIPTGDPDSAETGQLVHDLRALTPAEGLTVGITGETAIRIDVSQGIADALPGYLGIVIGLALILLLLVFRSVVIPVKALIGFLLTLAATTGAVVAVFQWGWLKDLFGVEYTGPIIAFLPILGIGITFGLAMDYQVFLVSRMREEHLAGAAPIPSIVVGFAHSSRVVTAAALIMASVFFGFMLDDDVVIKSMGFALAFGVLIDAFVVRMTLVPAAMALLGKAAWWLPSWLSKVVPEIHLEGDPETAVAAEHTSQSSKASAKVRA